MSKGYSTFFEYLETEGMPSITDFPQVESPDVELPDHRIDISEIPNDLLATGIGIYSAYNAAAEGAAGVYAAAEEEYKQKLNHVRRQVYLEKHHNGEFKNQLKDHKNYLVDEDPRVIEAENKYQVMKQNHIVFKSATNSYEKMLLLYMSERKNRREYAINSRSSDKE